MHIACQWHEQSEVICLSLDVPLNQYHIPQYTGRRKQGQTDTIYFEPHLKSSPVSRFLLFTHFVCHLYSVCLVKHMLFFPPMRFFWRILDLMWLHWSLHFQCWCVVAYWQNSGIPAITSHCYASIVRGLTKIACIYLSIFTLGLTNAPHCVRAVMHLCCWLLKLK